MKPQTTQWKPVIVHEDPAIIRAVDKLARAAGLSRSAWLRQLWRNQIEQIEQARNSEQPYPGVGQHT